MSSSVEKKPTPLDEQKKRQREWVISELQKRAAKCFLCKWILENLEESGKLTGYPLAHDGVPVFPRVGMLEHLRLEGFLLPA